MLEIVQYSRVNSSRVLGLGALKVKLVCGEAQVCCGPPPQRALLARRQVHPAARAHPAMAPATAQGGVARPLLPTLPLTLLLKGRTPWALG